MGKKKNDLCFECGEPEKSKYSLSPGKILICSSCTMNKLSVTTVKTETKIERPKR